MMNLKDIQVSWFSGDVLKRVGLSVLSNTSYWQQSREATLRSH